MDFNAPRPHIGRSEQWDAPAAVAGKENPNAMTRIFLFVGTNLAILFILNISLRILGVDRMLETQSGGINMTALLVISAVIGMGGAFISLAMSKWLAKRSTGARVIERPGNRTERWLLDTVAQQARRAGIGMPEVAVYDAPEINAFATGMNRNNALVAVSTGLLANMSADEAEAVLGHEVSHVANGDMVTLTLIQGVVNTFVILLSRVVGHVVDRVVFRNARGYGPGYFITVIVAQVVLSILASMIVMWFSRRREFRADAGGAELAGRGKMIAALRRLRAGYGEEPRLPSEMTAFGISGRVGSGFAHLFRSHPPLDDRIAALEATGD